MTDPQAVAAPRTAAGRARIETTVENALSDADFGKNDGGYDNGRPRKNVVRFLEELERRGLVVAEAAPSEPLRAALERLRELVDRMPGAILPRDTADALAAARAFLRESGAVPASGEGAE